MEIETTWMDGIEGKELAIVNDDDFELGTALEGEGAKYFGQSLVRTIIEIKGLRERDL